MLIIVHKRLFMISSSMCPVGASLHLIPLEYGPIKFRLPTMRGGNLHEIGIEF
jgi:hypothetical protein